eukprot:scaffold7567_cov167-Ochromonas_danica.AAC.2
MKKLLKVVIRLILSSQQMPLQPLGPTVMKHRHLRARGYLLITLPFWEYKMDMTREQKVKVIKRVIAQVVE